MSKNPSLWKRKMCLFGGVDKMVASDRATQKDMMADYLNSLRLSDAYMCQ